MTILGKLLHLKFMRMKCFYPCLCSLFQARINANISALVLLYVALVRLRRLIAASLRKLHHPKAYHGLHLTLIPVVQAHQLSCPCKLRYRPGQATMMTRHHHCQFRGQHLSRVAKLQAVTAQSATISSHPKHPDPLTKTSRQAGASRPTEAPTTRVTSAGRSHLKHHPRRSNLRRQPTTAASASPRRRAA